VRLASVPTAIHDLELATKDVLTAQQQQKEGDAALREAMATYNAVRANPLAALSAAPTLVEKLQEAYSHYSKAVNAAADGVENLKKAFTLIGATADPDIRKALKRLEEGVHVGKEFLKEFHAGVVAAQQGDVNAAMEHLQRAELLGRKSARLFQEGVKGLEDKTLFFL